MAQDIEGSRVVFGPENIQFAGLEEAADRVKALGRWEVEISAGGVGLETIRKVVEVQPLAEDEGASEEGTT